MHDAHTRTNAPPSPDPGDPAAELAALRLRVQTAEALANAALVALEAPASRVDNRAYLLLARLVDDLASMVAST